MGYDSLWELDSESSVEPDGDCVGARSASQDTGHLHMDIRLSDKRRGGPEGDGRLVTGQSGEGRLQKWGNHHLTPLTFDTKTGVVSDEDTPEIWETTKEVVIEKVRRNKGRTSGGDSTVIDVGEVETRSPSRNHIIGIYGGCQSNNTPPL